MSGMGVDWGRLFFKLFVRLGWLGCCFWFWGESWSWIVWFDVLIVIWCKKCVCVCFLLGCWVRDSSLVLCCGFWRRCWGFNSGIYGLICWFDCEFGWVILYVRVVWIGLCLLIWVGWSCVWMEVDFGGVLGFWVCGDLLIFWVKGFWVVWFEEKGFLGLWRSISCRVLVG